MVQMLKILGGNCGEYGRVLFKGPLSILVSLALTELTLLPYIPICVLLPCSYIMTLIYLTRKKTLKMQCRSSPSPRHSEHTIIDTAAKAALEASPSLNELHERAHVCFAAIATQRARFPMVDDIR